MTLFEAEILNSRALHKYVHEAKCFRTSCHFVTEEVTSSWEAVVVFFKEEKKQLIVEISQEAQEVLEIPVPDAEIRIYLSIFR